MNSTITDIKMAHVWLAAGLLATCQIARGDFFFGRPQNLGPAINSPSQEMSPSISADGLSLYFASNRPGGWGEYDLWVSTRPGKDAAWEPAVNLGPQVNSPYAEMDPSISADGLSLYLADPHKGMGYGRPRPGGFAAGEGGNVWVVTRATMNDPWSAPVNLGPALNSRTYDQIVHPSISADGLSLYVHACDKGIGVARRASTVEPFGTPEILRIPGSHGANDWRPGISADERALFVSVWSWGAMNFDLWVTTRRTMDSEFRPMTVLPAQVNYPGRSALCPSVSADGSTLYFCSMQPGGLGGGDVWRASILPIVDFNRDEQVDIQDLLRLIESWGQDDPSVDVGPMPWGDGVVDAKDLEVLMSYWGQEVYGPSLVAYWKLDEGEGFVAEDSVGTGDGVLVDNPIWQPTGGKIGGALLLDGVDDYIRTQYVLNPAAGPFSVFAWIKGGTPGQVILSQTGSANWLLAEPDTGCLMTELRSGGRFGRVLHSQTVITDGAWHRVGLVWDNSNRILYVDDIEVASDTQAGLAGTYEGLYLGTGSTLAPASFWTGLIDDVRIYNEAMKPVGE